MPKFNVTLTRTYVHSAVAHVTAKNEDEAARLAKAAAHDLVFKISCRTDEEDEIVGICECDED